MTHRSEPSADDPAGSSDTAEFERIDWERVDGSGRRLPAERVALLVGLAALSAVYLYHRASGETYLVARWSVGRADWLLLLAAVVVVAYGAVPLVRDRPGTARLARRLRSRPATALCLGFLLGVLATAVYALVTGFQPGLGWEIGTDGPDRFQPPVGFAGPYMETRYDCVGPTTDAVVYERECYGTWTYPLGTDRWGYDVVDLLVVGTRPVLYAAVVTAGLVAPLAVGVGLVAGYYGGLLDDLLMAYVDVQLSVPAVVVYLLVYMYALNSLFVFLVAFGLLSWGGIARIVRSETLQRREEGYVLSARAAGASDAYVLRRHLLPNVSNTAVPAAFHLVAVIVLTEAGLSFLGFHPSFQSWGMTIAEGLFNGPALEVWWNSVLPAAALAATVAALKVAGDGVRDVLDPRGDEGGTGQGRGGGGGR